MLLCLTYMKICCSTRVKFWLSPAFREIIFVHSFRCSVKEIPVSYNNTCDNEKHVIQVKHTNPVDASLVPFTVPVSCIISHKKHVIHMLTSPYLRFLALSLLRRRILLSWHRRSCMLFDCFDINVLCFCICSSKYY